MREVGVVEREEGFLEEDIVVRRSCAGGDR